MINRISLPKVLAIIAFLAVLAVIVITTVNRMPATEVVQSLDETIAIATPTEPDNSSVSLTTVLSLILALFTSSISVWLYRWRLKINLTGSLVPEEWGQIISEAVHAISKNTVIIERNRELNEKLANFITGKSTETRAEIKSVKEMLLTFQQSLDEKDIEIKRLKEGYDTKILHGNLSNLAALHEKSSTLLSHDQSNKSLGNFIVLLEDSLESSGVSIAFPETGVDFALWSDFIEIVGTTSSEEDNISKGQITEVLSPYYLIRGGERQIILSKSKIKYHLPAGD